MPSVTSLKKLARWSDNRESDNVNVFCVVVFQVQKMSNFENKRVCVLSLSKFVINKLGKSGIREDWRILRRNIL